MIQSETEKNLRQDRFYYWLRFPAFPGMFSGSISHKSQIENGPEALDTQVAVYTPMQEGRGIDDGADKRMKAYKKAKKKK